VQPFNDLEMTLYAACSHFTTNHPKVQVLVYAATMRFPESVADTLNAYIAFRSALFRRSRWAQPGSRLLCSAVHRRGRNAPR
jgi:hypothetical protein